MPAPFDLGDRRNAVLQAMQSRGVDLLVAASAGRHRLDRSDPVVFLTGYRSLGESIFALWQDGRAQLIVSPAFDAERVAQWPGPFDRVATGDLAAACADLPGTAARIATAGFDALPNDLAEALLASLAATQPGEMKAFDGPFFAAWRQKSAGEIDRARRATAIAEQGMERLLELARPGMAECDLATELLCDMKALGAEDNFLMLNAAPRNFAVMPSSARRLQPGDILLTEISPSFDGQFTQICRTAFVGEPGRELRRLYDLVIRAMWAGIEAVRPGVPVSAVCAAIDGVLADAGYAEYCHPPHIRRRGHGLGSASIQPGDIALDNETILEENMIFVVHPNQFLPETGYLLCGEPVRVTATGVEVLSQRTAALGAIGS